MEKYGFLLVVVACILYVPALGEIELPESTDRYFLIGQPYPALTGIEKLYVVIVQPDSEPNEDIPAWKELKIKVEQKLKTVGIGINQIRNGRRDFDIPELTVDICTLKLEDSHQYIFRIQTSLARAVYLAKDSSLSIKADVWKAKPIMQAASVQDMPNAVTNLALQQVETFICAYHVANNQLVRSANSSDIDTASVTVPKASSKSPGETVTAEYEYVASKNSGVFHKPDCRWAENISPGNLVGYNSRDEAIEAGKRPCKSCQP